MDKTEGWLMLIMMGLVGLVLLLILSTSTRHDKRIDQLEQINFEACKDVYEMTGEMPTYCSPYINEM